MQNYIHFCLISFWFQAALCLSRENIHNTHSNYFNKHILFWLWLRKFFILQYFNVIFCLFLSVVYRMYNILWNKRIGNDKMMIYILWVWKLNTGKFCRCCKLSSTHHGHFDTNFDIEGITGLGFGKLFRKFVRVEYSSMYTYYRPFVHK